MKNGSIALTLVLSLVLVLVLIVGFSIFGGAAALPPIGGYGSDPKLPTPDQRLIPVINVANATGWTNGEQPVAAEDLAVTAFVSGLDHPRWLYALNGDILVAETNAPADRPEDSKGIKGWFFNLFQKKAGAGVPGRCIPHAKRVISKKRRTAHLRRRYLNQRNYSILILS